MNVPGQKTKGDRAWMDQLYCHPCEVDGHHVTARGYCEDCQHHLCQQCFDILPLRHHKLLDARDMPRTAPASGKAPVNKGTLICPCHSNKTIEIYCYTHHTAVCSPCAFRNHKTCDTEHLNDISNGYNQSPEYKGLEDELDQIQSTCTTKDTDATSLINNVKQSSKTVLKRFQEFRSNLNDHLDIVEQELLETAQKMEEAEVQDITDKQTEYRAMEAEALNQKANLQKYENNNCDLYIMGKKTVSTVRELQEKLQTMTLPDTAVGYSFHPDSDLEKFLSSKSPLGVIKRNNPLGAIQRDLSVKAQADQQVKSKLPHKLQMRLPEKDSSAHASQISVNLTTATLTPLPGINMKTTEDKHNCFITGVANLPSGRLLACDRYNKSIKCVDITNHTITSSLQLFKRPWDVTLLPQNQAAVTLPLESRILVISTSGSLSSVRTFSVGKYCRGIRSVKDKLVVSFTDITFKVEIIDYHGKVLQTITSVTEGQTLFNMPVYLAVNQENNRDVIYVSNLDDSTIIKLDMDGRVLYTYKNQDLEWPRGLAVTGTGEILICSSDNHQVHLLSAAGQNVKTLLSECDGIKYPQAICVSEEENKVFVSNGGKDEIKVYKLN